jgi:hypothetical protein
MPFSSKIKYSILSLILIQGYFCCAQERILTFGLQYKPVISSQFFGAGPVSGSVEYFDATRTPKLGHSFGMQIRRGLTKMISYETGINYVRRNYLIDCSDNTNGLNESFDFGLVGYEIPNQVLFYVRLGKNFYMNTATGVSFNWFASDVASSSTTVKFFQNTYLYNSWIKFALIANLGFELRTAKKGYYYLGASLTNPFKNIAETHIRYDENLTTADKVVKLDLRGGIFTIDFRYFFNSDPIKKKINDKKK